MSVLRLERGTGMLIHSALTATDEDGVDLSMAVTLPLAGPLAVVSQPDVVIAPGTHPRTVHICRARQDLWAEPPQRAARFRDWAEGRFEFLLVEEEELARLRAVLRHRLVLGFGEDGPSITMLAHFPFCLDMGIARLDVRGSMPLPASGSSYVLQSDVGEITITPAGPARDEILLRKRARDMEPPRTDDVAAWRETADCWLRLEGAEEYATPPITVCDADRNWMYKNPFGGLDHIIGRHRCRPSVAHETGKYVMLSRYAEGVVFDDNGICNEDGHLIPFGHRGVTPSLPPPPGVRLDHGRLFASRAALADAPIVHGDTIVFILGTLTNYTHWLIEGLLGLLVLLDFAPSGARLLLPATFRTFANADRRVLDHYDSLRVFGFDHLPVVEISEPFCRLEHGYWMESGSVFNMPGEYMRALRARVAGLRPAFSRRDRRIHVARRVNRRIANADGLAPFLARQGFSTHYLEDYSIDEQIDMFSEAEWVIGPHGAELGNLLFCQPGTKVLELAPEFDFKPYFSYMCNKLGLTHGVLPCPTTDGGFDGDLIVDVPKLAALFRMLKNRL